MTNYLSIRPIQEPFDLDLDEERRQMYAFNVNVYKGYSKTVEEEIVKLLEDSGIGTGGTDLFSSSKAKIPTGEGPYVLIRETGGTAPEYIHNDTTKPAYQRPSIQIVVLGRNHSEVKTKIWEVYETLFVTNQGLTV